MSNPDAKIARFVLQLGAQMAIVGLITLVIMSGLAALIPLPPEGLARDLRNGAGMVVAIVIGLRLSRWLERRWGGE